MAKTLGDLEQVEQELAELRNQLEQSFGVLDSLIKIQVQFDDLAQTYQKLKAHLDEVNATRKDVAQVQAAFDHRFAELEAFMKKLSHAGFDAKHFQKQTKLEAEQNLLKTQLGSTQSSLRNLQRELQVMRNRLIIAILAACLVLPSLTILLFFALKR